MWSDSHCHLFDYSDDEIGQVLVECKNQSVSSLLNIGTDLQNSQKVIRQCKEMDGFVNAYAAAGISAADVGSYVASETWESELRRLLSDEAVIALGEIGIDSVNEYYAPYTTQLQFFRRQLKIAKEFDLPVVVHSRGAEASALKEVVESGIQQAVFHCFTGDFQTASKIVSEGYYVSFSGIVTFKRSGFDDVIRAVPLNKMLIETDSPYLAPVPKRGKKNQPAWVSHVGSYIAGVLGISEESVAKATSHNFHSFLSV